MQGSLMVEINRYSEHSGITLSELSKGTLAKITGGRERGRERVQQKQVKEGK